MHSPGNLMSGGGELILFLLSQRTDRYWHGYMCLSWSKREWALRDSIEPGSVAWEMFSE